MLINKQLSAIIRKGELLFIASKLVKLMTKRRKNVLVNPIAEI
jgi:hypothetical protein